MPNLSNKTRRPLSVPLPRGKSLHLGPLKTGEVNAAALEHAPLKKLIEAGDLEVVDAGAGPRALGNASGGKKGHAGQGFASAAGSRRSGDR